MPPVLYVTRKFPPSVGGMETLASGTWGAICDLDGAELLAHGGTNRALPRWLPSALWSARRWVVENPHGTVLWGDAAMAAVGVPALAGRRVRQAAMVMGLDLTLPNAVYRRTIRHALRHMASVIAISENTARLACDLGVSADTVHTVRLSVERPPVRPDDRRRARAALVELTGAGPEEAIVGTVGRLVHRKGHGWFVANVLPRLPDVRYVVAGAGPEARAIGTAAERAGVSSRVSMLGAVDDGLREVVLRGVDLFVQPNVRTPGDVEGFGLVAIEAATRDTPVVASALEGLLDAVEDEQTGRLLPPEEPQRWVAALAGMLEDRESLAVLGARWGEAARTRFSTQRFRQDLRASLGVAEP